MLSEPELMFLWLDEQRRTNSAFVVVSVLEQKIEQEEETNKSSADLRIRKTQVSLF